MQKYTRHEALKIILQRFAHRHVLFDTAMAKVFYKLPEEEIKSSINELISDGVLCPFDNGYMLKSDLLFLESYTAKPLNFVYAIHRNDFLYKSNEHILKEQFKPLYDNLPYDHEPLQYLLIDGEFHGACVGHFRNGPYDLNDVVCDLPNATERKYEILETITYVNFGRKPIRFLGKEL